MLDVQKKALVRLIAVLSSLQAKYKIILPDGTEYGTLEVKATKPERKTREKIYPHGERAAWASALIGHMQPNDVLSIPVEGSGYKPLVARQAITATAHRLWGVGNYITCLNEGSTHVEVMRTA